MGRYLELATRRTGGASPGTASGDSSYISHGIDRRALIALVKRVAVHYKTPAMEVELMLQIALADPVAAWTSFSLTAVVEGI
jgi:hypothetical protein